jgi:hypothetical protein
MNCPYRKPINCQDHGFKSYCQIAWNYRNCALCCEDCRQRPESYYKQCIRTKCPDFLPKQGHYAIVVKPGGIYAIQPLTVEAGVANRHMPPNYRSEADVVAATALLDKAIEMLQRARGEL